MAPLVPILSAMKLLLPVCVPLCLLVFLSPLAAATGEAEWRAADDARVAAMVAGERAALARVFSDDLFYLHSNGRADSKASFIDALAAGRSNYHGIDYEKREFRAAGPGAFMISGRVRLTVGTASAPTVLYASFLAVYRLEQGAWRMLGWQSCRVS